MLFFVRLVRLDRLVFALAKVASLLALTLSACFAGLQAHPPSPSVPEIEYAYPTQSVWTTRRNADGETDNPLLRLAAVLFKQVGIPWHGVGYPGARMFENLRNGKSEFSMLVKSTALQTCCLFSKMPVANTELRIYSKAGHPSVKSRADLIGKRVITILGFGYGGLLPFIEDQKNGISNQVAETHESAFAMLQRGRADYVLDYTGPSTEVLAVQPIRDVKFDVLDRLDIYLVLSRKRPNAPQLMARLETIAESLNKAEILWPTPK
jgi:polar amino acid transport system substrate-binding protein